MHWRVEQHKKEFGVLRDSDWLNDLSPSCKMNSSIPLETESLIYTEVTDDLPEPTVEEIEEYAKRIGIDVENEPHLLFLAREGIQAKLPPSWSPCLDTTKNSFYYFNKDTLRSQWEHPMDSVYRDRVVKARGDSSFLSRPSSSLQPLNMRLPPVKKSGGGLGPINRTPSGTLGSLGGFGAPPSSADSFFAANNNNATLNAFKDSIDDDAASPPMLRPPRKLGLTLTGGGANFLKGSGPEPEDNSHKIKPVMAPPNIPNGRIHREETPDSDEPGASGDAGRRPIKSILVNSLSRSRPSNPSDNVYELDGFSVNLDEMTEEERVVISQLDSLSMSKSKGNNVKFNLDDNTELKFEMPEEDEDRQTLKLKQTNVSENDETEDEEDGSNTSVRRERPRTSPENPRDFDIDKLRQLKSPNYKNLASSSQTPAATEYSDSDIDEMKAAMRKSIEDELQKFKDQLEGERKSRQEQIQKHLEQTIRQYKMEKDDFLKKFKKEIEEEKDGEITKTKKEMDNLLRVELAELKTKFDDDLQRRQKQLAKENEKNIEALTAEFRKKQEEKVSEALKKHSSEELLKKEKDEQLLQLKEMKEQHKLVLEKLKADLKEEEEKLRQDHTLKRADIVSKFEQETEELKKRLVRSQEEMLRKVQEDFEVKRASLEKSLNASLQDVKNLVHHQNKRSASETNIADDGGPAEAELHSMKLKYQQLEGKYQKMKKDLHHISQNITNHHQQSHPVKSSNYPSSNNAVTVNKKNERVPEKTSPKKVAATKRDSNNKQRKETLTSDSANGSESNTDSNSSLQFSDGPPTSPEKLKRANTADDPVEDLTDESNSARINAALLALEVLKQEIMELKETSSNKPSTARKPPSTAPNANIYKSLSARKSMSKQEQSYLSKRNTSFSGQTSAKGSKSARVKDISTTNNTNEVVRDDAYQKVVENAKAFIRLQNNRLKDATPVQSASQLLFPSSKSNLLLFDDKILKSVSAAATHRPASIHVDLFSETDTSGVSSLKDPKSSAERKQLSKEINQISTNLNILDQQMKTLWSVVKGKQQEQQLCKPSKLSTSLPASARKSLGPSPAPVSITMSNGMSQRSARNQAIIEDALRMSGLSTSRLESGDLLQSLEDELKEFNAKKLSEAAAAEKNNIASTNKPNNSYKNNASILEKTKDLQEWLKKY